MSMKEYVKKAQNNYNSNFDIVTLRLPKGTKEEMRKLVAEDVNISDFCIRAIMSELNSYREIEPKPTHFNGKPILSEFAIDDVKKKGKWWRKYAFFTDDAELDTLFIKALDTLDKISKIEEFPISSWRQSVDLARLRDKPESRDKYVTKAEEEADTKEQLEELKKVLQQFVNDQDYDQFVSYL